MILPELPASLHPSNFLLSFTRLRSTDRIQNRASRLSVRCRSSTPTLRSSSQYGPYNLEKLKGLFAQGGFKLPGLKPQDAYERDLILFDALACKPALRLSYCPLE